MLYTLNWQIKAWCLKQPRFHWPSNKYQAPCGVISGPFSLQAIGNYIQKECMYEHVIASVAY